MVKTPNKHENSCKNMKRPTYLYILKNRVFLPTFRLTDPIQKKKLYHYFNRQCSFKHFGIIYLKSDEN